MSLYDEKMDLAQKHISVLLDQIDHRDQLEEFQCFLVITELKELQGLLCTPRERNQKYMDERIENLFDEFNNIADGSRELLQEMLLVISEGRAPQIEEMVKLGRYINELREKYDSIYTIALGLVSEDEMPVSGLAAKNYVEAVRNSASILFKKQLVEIQKVLEEFVAVQSLVSNYATALLPYQDQAKNLLGSIANDSTQDAETLESEIAGLRVFLEALACEYIDSDEGIKLLDQVGEYYPRRIQNGLAAGKYFITTSSDTSAEELPQKQDEVSTVDESPSIEVLAENEVENDATSVVEDDSEDTSSDNIEPQDPIVQDEKPTEISEFAQLVIDSGVLLETVDRLGVLMTDISPNESKKITASVFQNDIRKGNEKASKDIFKRIDTRNVINLRFLSLMKCMPEEIASGMLDSLLKKGYLRKYVLTPGGEFYSASPRLMKALTFKDAARTIGIRQKSVDDWGVIIEDKDTSVASRIVYNKLYCDSIQRLIDAGETSFVENGGNLTDCFASKVGAASKSSWDLNVGAFWNNSDECDDLVKKLGEIVKNVKSFTYTIFAAVNADKAKILAMLLMNRFEGLVSKEIYLYSLKDDSYYTYPNLKKLDVLVIGNSYDEVPDEADVSDLVAKATEESNESDAVGIEEAANGNEHPVAEAPAVEKLIQPMIPIPVKKPATEKSVSVDANNVNVVEQVINLINNQVFYAAVVYAKAYSLRYPSHTLFYNQLAHALNDPMAHCNYATDNVFTLIEKQGEFDDALVISTALRTFFSNQVRFDYNLKSFYSGVNQCKLLNDSSALSNVLYMLMEFKVAHQKGMDAYANYRSKSKEELDFEMRKLQQEARIFYENYVIGQKKEKAKQKRFLETKKLIFSVNSDFGGFLKAIAEGDIELQTLATEFLQVNFYKDDSVIEIDTIDSEKLWNYITVFWEKAGDLMMYRKNNTDLMSHLRSNIVALVTKTVQLIVKWCDFVRCSKNHTEDEGETTYKKMRKPLMDSIVAAIKELEALSNNLTVSNQKRAGVHVLLYTLNEILACLDGTFLDDSRKYFYVPFLLTDEIMLDEDYYPDFDMHSTTMPALYPMTRIMNHVHKVHDGSLNFMERLTVILDDKGDNYGQARLIVDYLMKKSPSEELSTILSTIDAGEVYAKETANLRKDDFVGDLELAQSYGQIDNSEEDTKEKILKIIDEWYEWAVDTSNYGFFKRVMDSYLAEIKEDAKAREIDLMQQLESFKTASISGLSADAKEKRIVRIQKMIHSQNYTVAEDLLARANASEEENEEVIDEDFLKDFLDNYDDYYQPVATYKSSFANLVSSRTRNKEERGAKRLADNWLPGGSLLGKDRLSNLLSCFGFKVDSIKQQNAIGKFEHFFVLCQKAQGGQRDNYTHPIAAFGSGAALDGFRVVCINGGYDADGLIDVMKQISNAKHTLVLLDYALSKSERRRLARKSKNALGDKLFGVVDRSVMMFLVRNYDETKMNRMLISLITPFGYYQPYVWESANVMPPEIFMGRKFELERIKSPTGVNIVYGGRQLGKSALLKKAKEDIDWDENGNRAVLVDIKGMDFKKAANKIGHELYDAFVLEQDIDTDEWNDLSRVVRKRLQSDNKRIPYLLLLLDEADAFIDSCVAVNYQPFDALKDIQSIGAGRFKFVIAGLRNIVRFKLEALDKNSVLTHLQSMTVKPFNTSEARELMETPLHYLGLRFSMGKESLISLILATTNYFPGLIQMYCAKLINAMRSKDYANYDEVDTPIYEISEEHIKKVLADPEFMQQIREKFIITLKLDEDNYYYLIALLMAYLYHNNGYSEGYSAGYIKNAAVEIGITKIANYDINKLESFMAELKELNVFRSTDESRYLFTRFTFFQMMGTRAEVDDKLMEYIGE